MSAPAAPPALAPAAKAFGEGRFQERSKEGDVRQSNLIAAKGVADAIRSSLGPKGMDKMIQGKDGEVIMCVALAPCACSVALASAFPQFLRPPGFFWLCGAVFGSFFARPSRLPLPPLPAQHQ